MSFAHELSIWTFLFVSYGVRKTFIKNINFNELLVHTGSNYIFNNFEILFNLMLH